MRGRPSVKWPEDPQRRGFRGKRSKTYKNYIEIFENCIETYKNHIETYKNCIETFGNFRRH
jgi:hypothetical protein